MIRHPVAAASGADADANQGGTAIVKRKNSVLLKQMESPSCRSVMLENLSHSVHRYAIGKMSHEKDKYIKHVNRTKAKLQNAQKQEVNSKNIHVNSGGHIARQLMDATDEHFQLIKPPMYTYPLAKLPRAKAVSHPDWDHHFTVAGSLTNPTASCYHTQANDDSSINSDGSSSTLFSQSMGMFLRHTNSASGQRVSTAPKQQRGNKSKHPRRGPEFLHTTYLFLPKLANAASARSDVSFVDDVFIATDSSTNVKDNISSKLSPNLGNSQSTKASSSSSSVANASSRSSKNNWPSSSTKIPLKSSKLDSKIEDSNLFDSLLDCWHCMLYDFRDSLLQISSQDLYEICKLREPPAMLVPMIGYLCLLIGVEPTWSTAKKTVLKEVAALKRMLMTINPSALPLGYAMNAVKYKMDFMAAWDEREAGIISKAAGSILYWINQFNAMLSAFLDVRMYHASDEYLRGHGVSEDVANSDDNSVKSKLTCQIGEYPNIHSDEQEDSVIMSFLEDLLASGRKNRFKSAFWKRFSLGYDIYECQHEAEEFIDDDDDDSELRSEAGFSYTSEADRGSDHSSSPGPSMGMLRNAKSFRMSMVTGSQAAKRDVQAILRKHARLQQQQRDLEQRSSDARVEVSSLSLALITGKGLNKKSSKYTGRALDNSKKFTELGEGERRSVRISARGSARGRSASQLPPLKSDRTDTGRSSSGERSARRRWPTPGDYSQESISEVIDDESSRLLDEIGIKREFDVEIRIDGEDTERSVPSPVNASQLVQSPRGRISP